MSDLYAPRDLYYLKVRAIWPMHLSEFAMIVKKTAGFIDDPQVEPGFYQAFKQEGVIVAESQLFHRHAAPQRVDPDTYYVVALFSLAAYGNQPAELGGWLNGLLDDGYLTGEFEIGDIVGDRVLVVFERQHGDDDVRALERSADLSRGLLMQLDAELSVTGKHWDYELLAVVNNPTRPSPDSSAPPGPQTPAS